MRKRHKHGTRFLCLFLALTMILPAYGLEPEGAPTQDSIYDEILAGNYGSSENVHFLQTDDLNLSGITGYPSALGGNSVYDGDGYRIYHSTQTLFFYCRQQCGRSKCPYR